MFGDGYKYSDKFIARPTQIPNCESVAPGNRAYSADKIGPFSANISHDLFGGGKRNEVNFHPGRQCNYHEQNIHGDFKNYYTPISYEREINRRIDAKLKQYAENVERRRECLKVLLAYEENQQVQEIVEMARRNQKDYLLDAKIRIQQLRAKRESERLDFVKEKKIQQYLEKCEEIRPIIENRRLIETKEAQRMQMLEKENQKENERKINHLWYEMLMQEIIAQADKEERNNLEIRRKYLEDKNTWDLQRQQHDLQKLDELREKTEEAIQLNNLKEEIRRDEIAELDTKRRKRDECYRDIIAQIREKQEALSKEAFEKKLMQEELNKQEREEMEKEKSFQVKERLRREMDQYHEYILRLNQERKDEEKRLDELIEQELKEIQEKQDEARKKYHQARQALQKAVREGQREQMNHKREEAEQILRLKQAENQMLKMAQDQNERLMAEYMRKQMLDAQQYREDLIQQMEYAKLKKEEERAEIEKHIILGQLQEEEYRRNLFKIINSDVKYSQVHPFRQAMNQPRVPCPKNLYF